MFSVTVADTGQITLPQAIRDYLNLDGGSKIDFIIDEEGQVRIIPLDVSVETLSGILYRPDRVKVTLEEMDVSISEWVSDWQ
ncbi:AbrB/MazE/SpoVT family DNA-binding domain-containing protein [Oscillatoria sp. FACHB-1406]|uniref:AbrB/MazE/SpoVT family DNA-binding domain-containing protein n=1 Tax=Oscillatoria sp. FACHB-1406 TaxID=2692846 RepID=UPI001684A0C1|nr:AbrB/MazE/SpoVT family DNA-binding domain-containing protein [Oscillatoria sp. FACHB-1406]MBD2580085.1 AbrB/MazE/SpoVT family DNA-binding domain-containing protein [Oscillatoria sp. FACHB-1406]